MKGETRKEHLGGIQKLFGQSKKFGDEKVQLALQTYELVGNYVKSLSVFISISDATVWKFESRFSFRFSSSRNRGFGMKKTAHH